MSPLSFFQVNPKQTEKLYGLALDYAGLTGNETVVDAYCGAGTISLLLAQKAKKVIGIEIVPEAIQNANENAARNNIANAEFRVGATEELLPQLVADDLRPDVIVLDPPRKAATPPFYKPSSPPRPNAWSMSPAAHRLLPATPSCLPRAAMPPKRFSASICSAGRARWRR